MADKECNYKNNDHCTIDTNYCAPSNTGQHCFIKKYADERQENKALKAENERLRKALELITEKAKSAEVRTYSFFEPLPDKNIEFVRRKLMQFQTIARAALQPVQEKSCESCSAYKEFSHISCVFGSLVVRKESCINNNRCYYQPKQEEQN